MHHIPLSCTSSPCNLVFLNQRASYGLVQATVGMGTVFIWDFCVAITMGGGGTLCFVSAPLHTRTITVEGKAEGGLCLAAPTRWEQ